jgi:hypothetical protein
VPAAELGQLGHEPVDTQSAFVVIMDFLDDHGELGIFFRPIRRGPREPCIETTAGHVKHLTHQENRDSFFAWLAPFFFIQITNEGELHIFWLANHAAAFLGSHVPSSNGGLLPQAP